MQIISKATVLAVCSVMATSFAETIDFTTPLAFTGGTEITESSDSRWNERLEGLAVSVAGDGNLLYGKSGDSNPWRYVKLTGDGYLTMQRDGQWSIALDGGRKTKEFSGTLHIKHVGYNVTYFGFGEGDDSFENGSLVFEAGLGNTVYFSNYSAVRKIGDLSTAGANPERITVRKKNGGTLYIGYANKSSTYGGVFANEGTTPFDIVKVGTGCWTLDGEVAITDGTFSVSEGSVAFNCPVSCAVAVAAGATLGGNGTVSGAVSAEAGAKLSFTETAALAFAGTADLTNFGIDTAALDPSLTYTVAKGTTSLPTLTQEQQLAGWAATAQDGNIVLKNTSTTISENLTLDGDTDWTDCLHVLADGVQVDLNGHSLRVAGVSVGEGAAFVNTGAATSRLHVGCNGGDKSFVTALDLGSAIMPVFTGAPIDLSGYTPGGMIGFMDTVGTQSLTFATAGGHGIALLGGANIAEAAGDDAWQTDQSRFEVAIYGDGNVISGGNYVSGAWRRVKFSGDGNLTMTRPAKWEFAVESSSNMREFSGVLKFVQDSSNEWYSHGVGDCSYSAASLVFEPVQTPGNWNVYFSRDWVAAPRHVGDISTAGSYASQLSLFVKHSPGDLYVGSANKSSTFGGNFADGETSYNLVKEGTGTWTLTGRISNGGAFTVAGGEVVLDGATFGNVTALNVNAGGRLSGDATIAASIPVAFGDGSAVSGSLTFGAQPSASGTVSLVPVFTGATASKLTLGCENPTLAGFTLEAEQTPVVPAGTSFVIAEGPEGSEIVAPALGASALAAGWEVSAVGNQVVLVSTALPPLTISGAFTLPDDWDYSTGSVVVEDGATIDLNGHSFKVSSIQFRGAASFTNGAGGKANLEVDGAAAGWLWTNGSVTLSSGVRPVICGAAVEIPQTYIPAGGIGFKDTVGTQYLYNETCNNGLAFLGNAKVTEQWKSWNFAAGKTCGVFVEGTGNVFAFNNDNGGTEPGAFTTTPFSGSGELTIVSSPTGAPTAPVVGAKTVDNSGFTGTIFLRPADNYAGANGYGVKFEDDNNMNVALRNGTVALARDFDAPVNFSLRTQNEYTKTINYNLGNFVTSGEHQEQITLSAIYKDETYTATLKVGWNGEDGAFAGNFTNYNGNTLRPFSIEKHGKGTWTLTGTVANGGAIAVAGGEVAFMNGIANATGLSVSAGAKALLAGSVAAPVAFAAGSTLALSPESPAAVAGDIDLSAANIEVRMGASNPGRTHTLLTAAGTITGFDAANVALPDFDYDTDKYAIAVVSLPGGGQALRYVSKLGFSLVVR